ncbi:hypothetical protein E3T43_16045 [Cryobacterium sp. Hh7]|uniref:hypothetical protein n=1 Tax=Cryobacterium sp. Hh7 TaxID=1259159 RepID=UPI00106B01CF|nr:hypothetical protein [Cryobacterium sp. Hh7]TFD51791.1 hypothetical protein E3T43_16045 [Cryobacterium sp. Hh7]
MPAVLAVGLIGGHRRRGHGLIKVFGTTEHIRRGQHPRPINDPAHTLSSASSMVRDSSSPSDPKDSPPNAANNASRACSTATIVGFELDSLGLSMNMGAIASFP